MKKFRRLKPILLSQVSFLIAACGGGGGQQSNTQVRKIEYSATPEPQDTSLQVLFSGHNWANEKSIVYYGTAKGQNNEAWPDNTEINTSINSTFEFIAKNFNINFVNNGSFEGHQEAVSEGTDIVISLRGPGSMIQANNSTPFITYGPSETMYYEGSEGDIHLNVESWLSDSIGYGVGSIGYSVFNQAALISLGLKSPYSYNDTTISVHEIEIGDIEIESYSLLANDYSLQDAIISSTPLLGEMYALEFLYGLRSYHPNGEFKFTHTEENFTYSSVVAARYGAINSLSFEEITHPVYISMPDTALVTDSDTLSGYAFNPELENKSVMWLFGDFDTVIAGQNSDEIHGSPQEDTIYGQAGDDIINGWEANDIYFGGDGADTFIFSKFGGQDKVKDFRVSEDYFSYIDENGNDATESVQIGTSERGYVELFVPGGGSMELENIYQFESATGDQTYNEVQISDNLSIVQRSLFYGLQSEEDLISPSSTEIRFDQSYAVTFENQRGASPTFEKANSTNNLITPLQYPTDENGKNIYWGNSNTVKKIVSFSFADPEILPMAEDYILTGSKDEDFFSSPLYEFKENEKDAIRDKLKLWSDVSNLQFVEVTETFTEVGTIRFFLADLYSKPAEDFTDSNRAIFFGDPNTYIAGYASTPYDFWSDSGDIRLIINPDLVSREAVFEDLSFGNMGATTIHELGHALGLAHPFEDNLLEATLDTEIHTRMSYTSPEAVFANINGTSVNTLSNTLGLLDILAVQEIYGANFEYNNTDTIYKIDPLNPKVIAIWDGGGEDLIDLSDFSSACNVSLVDGEFSTLSYETWDQENNFVIAYNCFIENIDGGKNDDVLTGNDFHNELNGGDGDDIIYGQDGNDIFDEDPSLRGGTDTFYGGDGHDTFVVYNDDIVIEYINSGTDTVWYEGQAKYTLPENVELLRGIGSDTLKLQGNLEDNLIVGGAGDDVIWGGGGADSFYLNEKTGHDRIMDFSFEDGDQILVDDLTKELVFLDLGAFVRVSLDDANSLDLIIS